MTAPLDEMLTRLCLFIVSGFLERGPGAGSWLVGAWALAAPQSRPAKPRRLARVFQIAVSWSAIYRDYFVGRLRAQGIYNTWIPLGRASSPLAHVILWKMFPLFVC